MSSWNDVICCNCSVAQSCPTLCNPMDCSTPAFPVLHYLPESAQTCVHWLSDAIQPSHPLLHPSPLALNLSQHESLFQWVDSSHQVAKVLELQWIFQWIFQYSNEYSGLISFRIDWFDLLSVQETLKSPPSPKFKSISFLVLSFLYHPALTTIHDAKNHSFD